MEYSELLNQVLMGVLLLMVTVAVPFFLKKAFDLFSEWVEQFKQSNPSVFDMIYFFAVEAVQYAEQAGILAEAEEKKAMAIAYLQRELDERGFSGIDVSVLSDKIEAALRIEINQFKEEVVGYRVELGESHGISSSEIADAVETVLRSHELSI